MAREYTYACAGVDRKSRTESKKALHVLKETFRLSHHGKVVQLPYGNIFPINEECYLDLAIEGVGTKVLVAQLAEKYDTIGIDGVAMAVNDVIRSGAKPLAIADNIHVQASNQALIAEWMKGIVEGATEADCVVPGGEIGDVFELIKGLIEGKGFDMIVASVGEVAKKRVIHGTNIEPSDRVIGLKSSGLHSNGISLARKILFKQWGGKYEPHDVPDGLDRELAYEVLEPTKIYVKQLLRVAEEIEVKAAVHITGDAYSKFGNLARFSKGIGFEFDNFNPQPIFGLIQKTAQELGHRIADEEMFKTFNMGWGFAVVVDKKDADEAVDTLERSGTHAECIGTITPKEGMKVFHGKGAIVLN